MKHAYHIKARDHEGRPVNAYVRASRATAAVRLVLDHTKTRFRSIKSIRRES